MAVKTRCCFTIANIQRFFFLTISKGEIKKKTHRHVWRSSLIFPSHSGPLLRNMWVGWVSMKLLTSWIATTFTCELKPLGKAFFELWVRWNHNCSSTRMALVLDNPWRLICHWTKKPNQIKPQNEKSVWKSHG